MTQALITVNASPGSEDDAPINTLVQLNNTNNGGEVTYLWTILSQPPGTGDALSSTTIQNPTFTPRKEGSYLIQLIVNQSLGDEVRDRVVVAVRQLKTRLRVPAPGEVDEVDATNGHAGDGNIIFRAVDAMRADPGIIVAQLGETVVAANVVKFTNIATIKTGLPGEEIVPVVTKAPANVASITTEELGLAIAAVDGGALTIGKLAYIRVFGLITNQTIVGAVDENPVYVSDTATLSSSPGTNSRRCGKFVAVGASAAVYFKG